MFTIKNLIDLCTYFHKVHFEHVFLVKLNQLFILIKSPNWFSFRHVLVLYSARADSKLCCKYFPVWWLFWIQLLLILNKFHQFLFLLTSPNPLSLSVISKVSTRLIKALLKSLPSISATIVVSIHPIIGADYRRL